MPPGDAETSRTSPDALGWEALGVEHSAWLSWILSGRLQGFYGLAMGRLARHGVWVEWSAGIVALPPRLRSAEVRLDLPATSRREAPGGTPGAESRFVPRRGRLRRAEI
ncbi:DUF2625 family protein [Streptomyces sp. NPDC059994]|uniref:DUF2625 family protein n=1 Tax=Streptomyces sp. NPDC059994 TaxID=3347029 RepID=UPI0036CADC3F